MKWVQVASVFFEDVTDSDKGNGENLLRTKGPGAGPGIRLKNVRGDLLGE